MPKSNKKRACFGRFPGGAQKGRGRQKGPKPRRPQSLFANKRETFLKNGRNWAIPRKARPPAGKPKFCGILFCGRKPKRGRFQRQKKRCFMRTNFNEDKAAGGCTAAAEKDLPEFRPIRLEDKSWIDPALKEEDSMASLGCFGTHYLWGRPTARPLPFGRASCWPGMAAIKAWALRSPWGPAR